MTLDTAIVSEGWAQRATGRHEGKQRARRDGSEGHRKARRETDGAAGWIRGPPGGTKGNRGRSGVAQRATGRHEGKTGGRRQSAGGMMGRGRRRVRDIKGAAKSWRKRKGRGTWTSSGLSTSGEHRVDSRVAEWTLGDRFRFSKRLV